MKAANLTAGNRPISPVLRPHFITKRQYANLVKAAEPLFSAINRVEKMTLGSARLQSRIQMLPAEKMLASMDPGYPFLSVTSLLDTNLHNGSLRFTGYAAETPAGVAFGEALDNLFYDAPPVKEFRKKYSLGKLGGTKHLLSALLKSYKEFGVKNKKPTIAILEFRQPFQSSDSSEYVLLAEFFRHQGYRAEVVSPDQLEYRNGQLRRGDFTIDLIYRRIKVAEFLVRFDLTHPLVRAYRDRAVCIVNSFRSELAQKKAIFDLLTDETITHGFPAVERKAIREFIPWTRVVAQTNTSHDGKIVDLRLGTRAQAGAAFALRRAGRDRADHRALPDLPIRQLRDSRHAHRRASTFLPRQGAGLFELVVARRAIRIIHRVGTRAHLRDRHEVTRFHSPPGE
ncbi:MAG: hypothetical protein HY269_05880 [Deltaproteobacteria bacterium]|nr:hypothetical protein [Deltaproteobacteria bacterium]